MPHGFHPKNGIDGAYHRQFHQRRHREFFSPRRAIPIFRSISHFRKKTAQDLINITMDRQRIWCGGQLIRANINTDQCFNLRHGAGGIHIEIGLAKFRP